MFFNRFERSMLVGLVFLNQRRVNRKIYFGQSWDIWGNPLTYIDLLMLCTSMFVDSSNLETQKPKD